MNKFVYVRSNVDNNPQLYTTLCVSHTHKQTHLSSQFVPVPGPQTPPGFVLRAAMLLSNYTVALSHTFLTTIDCLFLRALRGFIPSVTHPHAHRARLSCEYDLTELRKLTFRSPNGQLKEESMAFMSLSISVHLCHLMMLPSTDSGLRIIHIESYAYNHMDKHMNNFALHLFLFRVSA